MSDNFVIVNGVRYVKDLAPTTLSFWYMNDNHTFIRIKGGTLSEIVASAMSAHSRGCGGMLCSAKVLSGTAEVRTVGGCVHDHDSISVFLHGVANWAAAIEADPEVMRMIDEGKVEE